jgi:GNAT superfamily N-acetyltransferase
MVIRQASVSDAASMGRVNSDSWRTTYQGIVPDAFLSGMTHEAMEKKWTSILSTENPSHFLVAEDEETGEIVGYVSGGKTREFADRFDAELYAIYLLQNTQQKGTGRRLLLALTEKLIADGMTSMFLWVLGDNRSRPFYEKMGGEYVTERTITIGDTELVEVAYGWEDIRTIR